MADTGGKLLAARVCAIKRCKSLNNFRRPPPRHTRLYEIRQGLEDFLSLLGYRDNSGVESAITMGKARQVRKIYSKS